MYFFDSDVCIEIMRGHLPRAQEIMRKSSPDLFGVPVRVVVSPKTAAAGEIELSTRDKSVKTTVPRCSAAAEVRNLLENLSAAIAQRVPPVLK